MFYKTKRPRSYRRPFYVGEKSSSVVATPPVQGGDYIAWEFENNLNEYNGNSTLNLSPYNGANVVYATGKINQCLQYNLSTPFILSGLENNTYPNNLLPPSDFSVPWGISFWFYAGSNSTILRMGVDNSTINDTTPDLWYINVDYGDFNFIYRRSITGNIEIVRYQEVLSLRQWNFFYFINDPSNHDSNYNFLMGINNSPLSLKNSSYDFVPMNSYPNGLSFYTYVATLGTGTFMDQLVFWHTNPKTYQDMLDLYNNGVGVALT